MFFAVPGNIPNSTDRRRSVKLKNSSQKICRASVGRQPTNSRPTNGEKLSFSLSLFLSKFCAFGNLEIEKTNKQTNKQVAQIQKGICGMILCNCSWRDKILSLLAEVSHDEAKMRPLLAGNKILSWNQIFLRNLPYTRSDLSPRRVAATYCTTFFQGMVCRSDVSQRHTALCVPTLSSDPFESSKPPKIWIPLPTPR